MTIRTIDEITEEFNYVLNNDMPSKAKKQVYERLMEEVELNYGLLDLNVENSQKFDFSTLYLKTLLATEIMKDENINNLE